MSEYSSAVLSDAPVAYYRLDEAAGTVANDSSGNLYSGIVQGVTTYSQTGAINDDADTALLLNGTTGALFFSPNVNPTLWTKYTLECWIKITAGWQHLIVTYSGTTVTKYLNGAIYTSGSGDIILLDQGLTWVATASNATLDEVALYNSVFTDAQVAWHYNVGTTGRTGLYMLPTAYRRAGDFAATYRRGT